VTKAHGEKELTFTDRRTGEEKTGTALRSWWEVRDAPHFTVPALLAGTIPSMAH
jgi:tRNA(His) guanylyltransferase